MFQVFCSIVHSQFNKTVNLDCASENVHVIFYEVQGGMKGLRRVIKEEMGEILYREGVKVILESKRYRGGVRSLESERYS